MVLVFLGMSGGRYCMAGNAGHIDWSGQTRERPNLGENSTRL